jgi:hypothetical protein
MRIKILISICIACVFSLAGTSASAAKGGNDSKEQICHITGSTKNPVRLITISENAKGSHESHGDFSLPVAGSCVSIDDPASQYTDIFSCEDEGFTWQITNVSDPIFGGYCYTPSPSE